MENEARLARETAINTQVVPQVLFSKNALVLKDRVSVNPQAIGTFLSENGMDDNAISNLSIYIDSRRKKLFGDRAPLGLYRPSEDGGKEHVVWANVSESKKAFGKRKKSIYDFILYHELGHALDITLGKASYKEYKDYFKRAHRIDQATTFLAGCSVASASTVSYDNVASLAITSVAMIMAHKTFLLYVGNKSERSANFFALEEIDKNEPAHLIQAQAK